MSIFSHIFLAARAATASFMLCIAAAAQAEEPLFFTDPSCCVLRDVSLSNEMNVATSLFDTAQYPTQRNYNPTFVGEYRGVYGQNWRPMQSTFRGNRGNSIHGGVDIYAPSFPGPLRTAVVAPVGGEMKVLPDSGGAIGNRVWISFKFQGEDFRLILGHLSGFEGTDRSVSAGEVIGYAGCTGNAASTGDCTQPAGCGLTSGHVHLVLINDSRNGERYDAAKALRWNLAFGDEANSDPC